MEPTEGHGNVLDNEEECEKWQAVLGVASAFRLDFTDNENGFNSLFDGITKLTEGCHKMSSQVPSHAVKSLVATVVEPSYPSPRKMFTIWNRVNCSIPENVPIMCVPNNIKTFLEVKTKLPWSLHICAYANVKKLSDVERRYLFNCGVHVRDTLPLKKDDVDENASENAIRAALLEYTLDNSAESCLMLITRDVDFVTLNVLHQRGYKIYIAVPDGVNVSPDVKESFDVSCWSNVVRGEVPTSSLQIKDGRVPSKELFDRAGVSKESSTFLGDVMTILNCELVKLLKSSGGGLPLEKLAAEYQKMFKKDLCVKDYDSKAYNLVDLLKKTSDVSVEGRGYKKVVKLQRYTKTVNKDDKKGKGN